MEPGAGFPNSKFHTHRECTRREDECLSLIAKGCSIVNPLLSLVKSCVYLYVLCVYCSTNVQGCQDLYGQCGRGGNDGL